MKELLTRYALLDAQRKEAQARADKLKAELARLEEPVMEAMLTAGVDKVRLTDPPVTIYLHRQLWANATRAEGETTEAAYARACAELEAHGLGAFVTRRFNVQSLSAYFRDEERNHGEVKLAPELAAAIKISEVVRPRVVAS